MYDNDLENLENTSGITPGVWPQKNIRIDALTTCVGLSDILSWMLLFSKSAFDRLVVVTKPTDTDTIRVCDFHNVEVFKTEAFGERFNKGRAINACLAYMQPKGFVAHCDCDILLPNHTRKVLQSIGLQEDCIYGFDRYTLKTPKQLFNFISQPKPFLESNVYIHTDRFPIGARVYKSEYGGYLPIGFAQIWHMSHFKGYEEIHETAARGDMRVSMTYPRNKRIFIPEIIALHIESEPSPVGYNWEGRKSRPYIIE